MKSKTGELGSLVKIQREHKNFTQEKVAAECGAETNRSAVAHLEQGLRIPTPDTLRSICEYLDLPSDHWEPFTRKESLQRFELEELLSELLGREASLDMHDPATQTTAESKITSLFSLNPTAEQLFDIFNSVLVYYGAGPVSKSFFNYYFDLTSFSSIANLKRSIERYQIDAIRLYPTFMEAFSVLSTATSIENELAAICPVAIDNYQLRDEWNLIEEIRDELLPDLGYISAKRVRQEAAEREWLIEQLKNLADSISGDGVEAVSKLPSKTKRKIDSLLRKFESTIEHGVSSPLFQPDHDVLNREATRLAPRTDEELARMESTQQAALRNLARYLAADYMDVYMATSMRTNADYVSVSHFACHLFTHDLVRPLKLRFFNPTQSWIDDRVSKGLVEALMLKRASLTIYMAQKSDTFGKDSEASVALGQGKPVIVYVPKFLTPNGLDSEKLFGLARGELENQFNDAHNDERADDTMDTESLVAGILRTKLDSVSNEELCRLISVCWADFDLYSEDQRFEESNREQYRRWLDDAIAGTTTIIPDDIRDELLGALVATAVVFERRAKLFREVHPLALQVILSTGVLNGILVCRSVEQCAEVLEATIKNELDLKLDKDENNYRVIEEITGSTVRVISRHELLRNSFESHYRRSNQ